MTAEQVHQRVAWYVALILAAPYELARARMLDRVAEDGDGRMVYTSFALLQGGTVVINRINDAERNN